MTYINLLKPTGYKKHQMV